MQHASQKSPRFQHRSNIGRLGEDIAVAYLLSHRYHIRARNFRGRYGEIDIIAEDTDTLVFVEVKTRIGNTFGTPEEAITPRKLAEVIRTSQYYLLRHPEVRCSTRVDVISVTLAAESHNVIRFRHFRNVTL